jgi:hypothetical protein
MEMASTTSSHEFCEFQIFFYFFTADESTPVKMNVKELELIDVRFIFLLTNTITFIVASNIFICNFFLPSTRTME